MLKDTFRDRPSYIQLNYFQTTLGEGQQYTRRNLRSSRSKVENTMSPTHSYSPYQSAECGLSRVQYAVK